MDMTSNDSDRFPSTIIKKFKNFTLLSDQQSISSSSIYLTYSATSTNDGCSYTVRVLNHESHSYKKNRNQALTLYFQELFYLCARFGSFIFEKRSSFEINDDIQDYSQVLDLKNFAIEGDKVAFVMKETKSLKAILSNEENGPKTQIDVERLIRDVYVSLNYINSNFKVPYIALTPENIYTFRDEANRQQSVFNYYIASWATEIPSEIMEVDSKIVSDEEFTKVKNELDHKGLLTRYAAPEIVIEQQEASITKRGSESHLAPEIYSLGLIALELSGIEYKTWKFLPQQEDPEIYTSVLETIVQRIKKLKAHDQQNHSGLGNLIAAMLRKEPNERTTETARALTDFNVSIQKMNLMSLESIEAKRAESRSVEAKEEEKGEVFDPERHEQHPEAHQAIENTPVESNKVLLAKLEKPHQSITRVVELFESDNVTKINISAEPLDCIDAEILKNNETWTNLEVIDIYDSGNRNQNQIAAAIGANNNWKKLWRLSLTKVGLGIGGAELVGKNTSWPKLEELDLSSNEFGDKGVAAIGSNTTWKNLRKLYLRRNRISDEGAVSIARNPTWVKLEELQLSENSIGDKGVQAIGSNTVWSVLRVLFLNNNNIHDEGAAALARNAMWVNLELLSLSSNSIEDKGAQALGSNMVWKKLKYFGLERNPFVKFNKGHLNKESSGASALYQNELFGAVIIPR